MILWAFSLLAHSPQLRAQPPTEATSLESAASPGPGSVLSDPLLDFPALERRGFSTFGWIEAGLGANNWGSPFNGPVVMADRSWQGQVNQMYLATERTTETDGTGRWPISPCGADIVSAPTLP